MSRHDDALALLLEAFPGSELTSMRRTIPKPSDRDEWLAARAPYIGASEAAALVGEHPFVDLAELAAKKISGRTDSIDNSAMRRGRHLEAAVAGWYEEEHGLALVEPTDLYIYDDTFMATLDRTVVGTTTAVEIKTTNRYITEPSRYWWWQCQVQLLCTGFTSVDLVVLDPSFELQCFTVAPDEEYQELIAEAGRKFLEHVRRGELPPEVDLTYRAASIMHPEPVATAVELDEEVLLRCRQLRNVSARIKSLQVDEDALKGMIGHALGDAAEGRHDDATVVTWRSVTRHGVDQKRLRAEHPEIAKELTTETKYRRLMVKEPK